MVVAEEDAVGEVGLAAGGPGDPVVGLAPGAGDRAALGAALAIAEQEGLALGSAEEAAGAAEVEHLGGAAEDSRDDPRRAGEPAGLGGGDDRGVVVARQVA